MNHHRYKRTEQCCDRSVCLYGTIPELGSSRNTTLDPPISASATDNLRFIPPDRALEYTSRLSASSTSSIFCTAHLSGATGAAVSSQYYSDQ